MPRVLASVRVGPAPIGTLQVSVPLLHHHADLLRQRRPPRGPRLHDGERRRPGPLAPPAGDEVFFLTGTDEHGQKVARAAEEHGVTPKEWTDQLAPRFASAWADLDIANDDFIRTTEPRHQRTVQQFLTRIYDNGWIVKDTYRGLYCVSCEQYYAEDELLGGRAVPDPPHPGRAARGGELLLQAERLRAPARRVVRGRPRPPSFPRPSATRPSASSGAACGTSRSPGPPSTGGCRCPGTRGTSSTSGTTR